jgi:hypothetical protein
MHKFRGHLTWILWAVVAALALGMLASLIAQSL